MSSLGKAVVLLGVILAIGAGLVFWKNKHGGQGGEFSSLSKAEMEVLLKDANPMLLKRLADNPEMKKQQIDNLKQLLALASEAQKDSTINTISTRRALEFIDAAVWAQSYDQEINKGKGPMPPFGFITEDQINAYYGDSEAGGFFGNATARRRKAELDQFVALNVEIMKKNNKATKEDAQPSEDELKQFRQQYAQVKIYEEEAKDKAKANSLPADFVAKTEVQSKLQRAQFLARQYQEVLAKRTEVTDADIAKYLSEHPEISSGADKKTKAEEVLNRVKAGEDFAALAKEFSEDPGSKDKGGLYEGIVKKQMVPEFENAALALEPGQVSPNLVETNYGYHIIKLEKRGETKDSAGQVTETYDARHILISTMMKDPDNPMGREMPVKDFVKQKLETEKEKSVLDQIMAANKITVAEDFAVPQVSEEELQKMMQQQMQQQMPQMPEDLEKAPDAKKPDAKKPDAKKPAPKPKN
ncbi:MAG: peptidylprolyl isomerase [Acidobacteria bacterium]|nr:peptidylprolyl isomerase [Acidobacteriota bacterium]MBK8148441.1 peptidylprolyl isomerase [Acidobacteriota bacterium]MBK8813276.1 peptidylprolyl isomerase [Acidobacteriota bacterium]